MAGKGRKLSYFDVPGTLVWCVGSYDGHKIEVDIYVMWGFRLKL